MTTSQLPRRPWAQLQPPDGGLDDVRRTAQVRRRRRTIAVAAVGSGVATTVTVLALLGGGGELNVLKTTVPPAVQPSPEVSRGTGVANPPAQRHGLVSQPASAGSQHTSTGSQLSSGGPETPASSKSTDNGVTSGGSPQLSRYRSKDTAPGGVHICGAQEYSDSSGQVSTANWCLTAIAQPVDNGVRLTVNACRDSTGGGVLTFSTTHEADVTVQRNGKTVWDWARSHPARASSHTLSAAAGNCWNWSLVWPDITQSGADAGKGTFTFVATSYAKEFIAQSTDTTSFTI